MTAPNHLAGGYCFTGIVSSILGINILGDYRLLIVIGVASLLPDIDHTKSLIGKLFFPLAKFLNRHYGHRTITHTLFALVGLTAIIAAFQAVYFPDLPVATVFGLAYGSHILFDCMTLAGVPFLYPFKKNAFVLPGKPEMRIRTSNVRHESMAFCFFIVSGVFMKPLMADGFWTTYNTLFGTFKHVVSEYHKSNDLLHLTFLAQKGTDIDTVKGFLVDISQSKMVLIDRYRDYHTYPEEGQLLSDFVPDHTGMKHSFVTGDLIEITADSLMRFISKCECTKIEVQATTKFTQIENGIETDRSKLSLDYPNQLHIKAIPQENKARFMANPAIQSTKQEITQIQAAYDAEIRLYEREKAQYDQLAAEVNTVTDYVRKEILMERFKKAKQPTPPAPIQNKIQTLRLRLQTYEQSDRNQYQAELDKYQPIPLTFTGTYERMLINGKDI